MPASTAGSPDPLEELKINLELWKHEEGLRQQRNTVFLAANAFLVVAAGAFIGADPRPGVLTAVGLVLASFGLVTSTIWRVIQRRHHDYANFRRKELRELGARLGYTTFDRQWQAFPVGGTAQEVTFGKTGATFTSTTRWSAIKAEGWLPLAVAVLWIVAATGSVAQLWLR